MPALLTVPAFGQGTSGGKKTAKSANDSAAKSNAPKEAAARLLIFPPDTGKGVSGELSDTIILVEQDRLHLSGKYDAVLFLRSLPVIRRALYEQTLGASEVNAPFDNDAKIKKLGRLLGYDRALVSTIADYRYDPQKQQVSLVLTARILDFSGPKAIIRAAAESGSTPEKAAKNENDVTAATQLARSLTDKIMTQLLKPASAPTTPAAADKK